jgi:YbgC/YbaW family acyl-CoA thioester hydrolase
MKAKTDFPAHCVTNLDMRVRFFETDLMGIVHHAAYFTYVEAGRVEYLRRRGADYRALTERGFHMPVVEAHLEYKRTSRFDDELVVACGGAETSSSRGTRFSLASMTTTSLVESRRTSRRCSFQRKSTDVALSSLAWTYGSPISKSATRISKRLSASSTTWSSRSAAKWTSYVASSGR